MYKYNYITLNELGSAFGEDGMGGSPPTSPPTPQNQEAFRTKPTTQAGPAQDPAAGARWGITTHEKVAFWI